jgi:hypothetical protein
MPRWAHNKLPSSVGRRYFELIPMPQPIEAIDRPSPGIRLAGNAYCRGPWNSSGRSPQGSSAGLAFAWSLTATARVGAASDGRPSRTSPPLPAGDMNLILLSSTGYSTTQKMASEQDLFVGLDGIEPSASA